MGFPWSSSRHNPTTPGSGSVAPAHWHTQKKNKNVLRVLLNLLHRLSFPWHELQNDLKLKTPTSVASVSRYVHATSLLCHGHFTRQSEWSRNPIEVPTQQRERFLSATVRRASRVLTTSGTGPLAERGCACVKRNCGPTTLARIKVEALLALQHGQVGLLTTKEPRFVYC